jgi:hypothetical protein
MRVRENGDFSLYENLWQKYKDNFNQVVYMNITGF